MTSIVELVIFDCDGVLVDSEPLGHSVLLQTAAEVGADLAIDEAIERFRGHSLRYCMDIIEKKLGRPLGDEFVESYRRRLYEAFRQELRAVEGVASALDRIDVPGCVASSGPIEKITLSLTVTGLLPRFEGRIFSAYERQRWKPDPDLFLGAARTLGVPPDRCVVVEDSRPGVLAGVRAGMRVLGFAPADSAGELESLGATTFDHMNQLPELLS